MTFNCVSGAPRMLPASRRRRCHLPAGDESRAADACRRTKNLFGLACQLVFIKWCTGIFCCHASLPRNGKPEMFVSSINPTAFPARRI